MPRSRIPLAFVPRARTHPHAWPSTRALFVALRQAVRDGALSVAYQPVMELPTRAWTGVEALARWTDPLRGPVPPDVFIPVAERMGLMGEITAAVGRQVGRDWNSWRAAGGEHLQVAVNVSGVDLDSDTTVDGIVEELTFRELPLDRLTLEITETAPLRVSKAADEALTSLRAAGAEIALDDFGAGYSRLADLRRVPATTLKLDKSFTHASGPGLADPAMAAGVQALADAFDLNTVAEGVETRDEVEALTQLGYERAQGWFFGRPITAAAVERALHESPPARNRPRRHTPRFRYTPHRG